MEKKVCVFLADGFEEIEGLTVVDLLRRAGIFVTTVSITGKLQIRGSHDICVRPINYLNKFVKMQVKFGKGGKLWKKRFVFFLADGTKRD